tara:strand:- start:1158 stop:2192 length:1035 start_codon:yes stop_codon:yes gene_type:complete
MKNYDLVIVGSGIVGSALAFYSSLKKKKVLVIEKNYTGYNSSGNAQGGLAPYLGNDLKVKKLHNDSYSLHQEFKENFYKYTNINPQYHSKKLIHIIKNVDEKNNLFSNGFNEKDILDLKSINEYEPRIKKAKYGALIFDKYMEVDSFKLTNSFKDASINLGADYCNFDFKMSNLDFNGDLVDSVNIEKRKINTKNIAITAGPWTSSLAKDYDQINVKPLKGQLLKVKTNLNFDNSVSWGRDYATKKYDDLLWIGTTEEDVNFTEGPTEEAKKQILNSFKEIFQDFNDMKVVDHTACFRPYSKNNNPIVKKSDSFLNLFYGTGAGRNGIKLGPAMGLKIYKKIFN